MIGTGNNNWACGLGSCIVWGASPWDGVNKYAVMDYFANTLARPTSSTPISQLTQADVSPYINYFDEYPYINIDLGDTVNVICIPSEGYFFVGWLNYRFPHTWEDTNEPLDGDNRIKWPADAYISFKTNDGIVVDQGMMKLMARMAHTIDTRWVLFTRDLSPLLIKFPSGGVAVSEIS